MRATPTTDSGRSDDRPIGVFDSGVGGLTVARALMDLLPDERVCYVGDTARGPYGPRPLAQVRKCTDELVAHLADRGTKLVVAACNTATAAALSPDALVDDTREVPVVGVVTPAAAAAARATRNGRVGVVGTVGTVSSGAYHRAVAAVAPDVRLVSRACPEFVALVEAGRTTDPDVLAVARDYLAPLIAAEVDTVILGCTHYPLLTGVLSYVLGPDVVLVSSAEETARTVFRLLVDGGLLAGGPAGPHEFAATGDPAGFAVLASRFLGPRVPPVAVARVPVRQPAGFR